MLNRRGTCIFLNQLNLSEVEKKFLSDKNIIFRLQTQFLRRWVKQRESKEASKWIDRIKFRVSWLLLLYFPSFFS